MRFNIDVHGIRYMLFLRFCEQRRGRNCHVYKKRSRFLLNDTKLFCSIFFFFFVRENCRIKRVVEGMEM